MPRKRIDLTNQQFGRLLVKNFSQRTKYATLWNCVCACGNSFIANGSSLRRGYTMSCGCLRVDQARIRMKEVSNKAYSKTSRLKDEYTAVFNCVYGSYKYTAKRRKLSFGLSKEDVAQLFGAVCYYCGDPPSNTKTVNGKKLVYTGIDRVDSTKGYEVGNVVPCCFFCNNAKRNMPQNMFIEKILKITNRFTMEVVPCPVGKLTVT